MDSFENGYGPPFSTLCRTCLRPKEGMKPLCDSTIIDMLMYCASVEVVHGDGLPSNICLQCLRQVNKSCSFKKLCEKSDSVLRKYILYGCLPHEDVLQSSLSQQIDIVDEKVIPPQELNTVDMALEPFVDQSQFTEIQHFTTLAGHISEDDDASGYTECPELGLEPECNLIENALAAMKEDILRTDLPNEKDALWLQHTDSIILDKGDLNVGNLINFSLITSSLDQNPDELENLMDVTNIEKSFLCQECKESFVTSEDLKLHMSVHSPGETFQCNACNKQFTHKKFLKRHIKIHMTWKAHSCHFCNKRFSVLGTLNKHIKSHSPWKEKKHLCMICGKGYQNSRYLAIHMRKHTGEKPFTCTECGKSFSDSRLLTSHQKSHTKEKTYQCIVCAKSFTHASTLTTHLRTHTGEKPYVCRICGKSFIQSSNLSHHMRTHTGEKPYECAVCKRSFASSSTLSYHLRTHTGLKPFQCTVCYKSFARNEDVNLHMRFHAKLKPFECPLCNKRFTTSSNKIQHMNAHVKKENKNCKICGKDCTIRSHSKNENSKVISTASSVLVWGS